MLISLCLIFILLCGVHYLFNYNHKAKMIRKIPGFRFNFIVGNALEVLVSPEELFNRARKWASNFNGIYGFYVYPTSYVNIYNPEDVKIVLSNMKYHQKSIIYKLMRPWLQNGLLLSSGTKWQERRKILTPTFHFNVLRKYYPIIAENTQRLLKLLENTKGEVINIPPMLSEFTLRSICESAMGTKLNDTRGKNYKNALLVMKRVVIKRFINILLSIDFIFDFTSLKIEQLKALSIIHEFTKSVIKNRKEQMEILLNAENEDDDDENEYGKKRIAFLDLLILAQKNGLTDDVGIQEEVDTFIFRGHDTVTIGLTYTLLLLAEHITIQNRVIEELCGIFGNDTRAATMNDLSMMQYLECCIKEAMRLYPPVPFISRKLPENVTLSNYTVPKGSMCHIHIYDLHRQQSSFENPLEYDPNRFLPENTVRRHPYAYIAFSAGPRNCIGQKFAMMEMKLVISSILRKFVIIPVTGTENLKFTADIILKNSNPVELKFIRRYK